jgi:glycosyltransferase involved in cell wall biosynthesis
MNKQHFPFVSVCIPVHNGSNYIRDSINSVLNQNYTNFELLIVDNCSTDETQSIVEDYNDERIRYIRNNKNIGGINNFTKCVEIAAGEYFVLLPHDDLLLSGAIKEFVLALENKNIGLVYSATQAINEHGDTLYKKINYNSNMSFKSKEALEDFIKNFMPIQCAMVRTAILKKLGGFDIKYSLFCDAHLWLRVMFEGWGVYYINTPKSCIRSHAEQTQRAFMNPDLDKLSEHWGKKLDKNFWKENSFNYLELKLSGFIFEGMQELGYETDYAKSFFIKRFVRSHMRSTLLSLITLDKFALILQLKLFGQLIKQYTFIQIITAYPSVILNEIWIRLFANNK